MGAVGNCVKNGESLAHPWERVVGKLSRVPPWAGREREAPRGGSPWGAGGGERPRGVGG